MHCNAASQAQTEEHELYERQMSKEAIRYQNDWKDLIWLVSIFIVMAIMVMMMIDANRCKRPYFVCLTGTFEGVRKNLSVHHIVTSKTMTGVTRLVCRD